MPYANLDDRRAFLREYGRRMQIELVDVAHPSGLTKRAAQRLCDRYGISAAEYFGLWTSQDGKCALCGVALGSRLGTRDVDHDHATGAVRGLLCRRCNNIVRWEEMRRANPARVYKRPGQRPVSESLRAAVLAYIDNPDRIH